MRRSTTMRWGAALCVAVSLTATLGARAHATVDESSVVLAYPRVSVLAMADDVRALDPESDSTRAVRRGDGTSVGLSILLPGLGQLHQGHKTRGTIFLVIETALWSTVAISEVQSHVRTDHAHEHAQVFAHVLEGAHSDQFYRDVSRYRSSDDYNVQIRRDARNTYSGPDSTLAAYVDAYEQANGYFGENVWRWDSFAAFREFSDLRASASDAKRRAAFAIGGALANRLFAVMDATRGRARTTVSSQRVSFDVAAAPGGRTTCAITTHF